jgi:hypothetical protein
MMRLGTLVYASRRYLQAREQYLASIEVDRLTLQAGLGTGG